MILDTKIINKQSKKKAVYLKKDETHTWIRIDGVETPLPNNLFKKLYEEDKQICRICGGNHHYYSCNK